MTIQLSRRALMLAVTLVLTGAASAQPMGGGGPPGMGGNSGPADVGTVTLSAQSVPMTTTLPGRIVASATAEIRPQVGGMVTVVNVSEGQQVAAGDVLFTIDAASYEAEVAVAEANVASAEAQLPAAEATVQRYTALVGSGGVAQTELDTAQATLAQAKASLISAEASLRVAQLTLERASVTAPIAGTVGVITAQIGALVTANQADALTTIRQLDPVDIELAESSSNLLALRKALASGELERGGSAPSVTLVLEDGSAYDQTGTVSAADVVISQTTGSFTIRASMPNPDRTLLPGMFVRATVSVGNQPNAFLVPQRAVTFNDDGNPTAYFVGVDGTAERRVLTASREVDNAWVVTSGVNAGDELIVDGLQKVSDGGAINPVAVVIEDNGVIYQQAPRDVAEVTP
ncbi:membrane fusion protein, multidrug efflux system [Devosia sp. YR412]|uniref:efflux RND transporter periplasmic adaptor subunit n=1 Tax=Devosia sp. YR412 TaxID=1881030 RepID=UPI0008D6BB68|nr:efflux RND transporter periplasmic adaptor subunit [Devosia sp. YR412]SEQ52480.1 membrane fusion protein, multidrug efflux system [Devosia sp. YR412]